MPKDLIKNGLQIYHTLKLLKAFCIYQSSEICMITVLLRTKWIKNKVLNWCLIRLKLQKGKKKITAEVQLHSDQGFQYTSQAYFNLTQSYGITPSMSRRGNPYDNALAENFFSILKTECIHRVKLSGYDEARLIISEYINFYNNYRIQTKTKLTPLEKRNQFVT